MQTLLQDLKYAFRTFAKNPTFTAIAVLTLALGIGANTAIFSLVNAVLLRSLPYRDSEALVKVWGKLEKEGIPRNWVSEPEWWDLQTARQTFAEMAAFQSGGGLNMVTQGAQPVRVEVGAATASFFPLLGVQPRLGGVFTPDDDQPGRGDVAMLSYELWKSSFGGDTGVLGRAVQLDGRSYKIIGVLPNGFYFENQNDIWLPLALDKTKPDDRGSHGLEVIARLKPRLTLAQADQELARLADQLGRTYPDNYPPDSGWGLFAVPFERELTGSIRPALIVLLSAVGFVLLIACANLANLLLVRASARQREIAIRAALGAGKWRLARQFLTESVLLSLMGGILGVLLALWGVQAFRGLGNVNIPRANELDIDTYVLLFSLGISVFTGLLFGLAPAWHVLRGTLQESLKEGARTSSGPAGRRLRANLVSAEVALALVLLAGAGLLVRSFQRLTAVSPGFQAGHLLTMRMALPQAKYPSGAAPSTFYRNVVEKISSLPGVQAAGTVTKLPLGGAYSSGSVIIENTSVQNLTRSRQLKLPYVETDYRWVTPGYFGAIEIPLRSGRLFRPEDDHADRPLVAIVDEDFARHFWPDREATGQRIAYDTIPNSNPPQPIWRTVVGVVGHVKNYGLDVQGREQAYFPQGQAQFVRNVFLAVRTTSEPASLAASIQREVASLDPEIPVYAVQTMDQLLSASLIQQRLNMWLLVSFSFLAVTLAAVGIYGVVSYSVAQRTSEIGVRVALGASSRAVLKMVLGQAMGLVAIGLAAGMALALPLTRLMSGLLFGVSPNDPLTFAVIAVLLGGVAFVACAVPARRATRVDPIVALRYE